MHSAQEEVGMSLAVRARLYKWICYRCPREVHSPKDGRCPDCGFALVIECDESPADALWREEMIKAQRAVRISAPLLLVNACRALAVDQRKAAAPPAPRPGVPSRAVALAVSLKRRLILFTGVAIATFIVGCALAEMIRIGLCGSDR
jgi:hypothetical protein